MLFSQLFSRICGCEPGGTARAWGCTACSSVSRAALMDHSGWPRLRLGHCPGRVPWDLLLSQEVWHAICVWRVQRDYFNGLECYSQPEQGLSRETNKSYSSGELRDEFKAGLEKGVLWGQRWWVKQYHSQHLLSWVMREFRYQGTPKKWKGHSEGNISAPLLYS